MLPKVSCNRPDLLLLFFRRTSSHHCKHVYISTNISNIRRRKRVLPLRYNGERVHYAREISADRPDNPPAAFPVLGEHLIRLDHSPNKRSKKTYDVLFYLGTTCKIFRRYQLSALLDSLIARLGTSLLVSQFASRVPALVLPLSLKNESV
jgi:hypothetical protein